MEDKIIETYREMLITGRAPITPFTICQEVGVSEKEFYDHFSSVDDIGRRIWAKLADEIIEGLNSSEEVQEYTALNKILAYYFTFFEVALAHRSFIERTHQHPALLTDYKNKFKDFIGDIIQEGIAMEEVVERFSLSHYYDDMLWQVHQRLIDFWLHDTSEHFVETEKAIEIYTKLPLELMQHNLFDSLFETMKFSVEQLKSNPPNVTASTFFRK